MSFLLSRHAQATYKRTKYKKVRRQSEIQDLREEIRNVNKSFEKLQQMMQAGGHPNNQAPQAGPSNQQPPVETYETTQGTVKELNLNANSSGARLFNNTHENVDSMRTQPSATTIYKDAVQPQHLSNSSEELINTSDESWDMGPAAKAMVNELQAKFKQVVNHVTGPERREHNEREPQPSTSRDRR